MKLLKNLLGTVLVLMIAVITFFTWNLIASLVSNYQSLSMTSISSLPMVILMCEIYVLLYATYDHVVLKRKDAYFYKKYSIILGCFAIAGIITSILDGTIVYHTFVGDYILAGFPLFMLIIHAVLLGISVYLLIPSIIEICKEKPEKTWKNPRFYGVRRVLVAFMLMFALEKLGGLVLLPIYWSSYDSGYVVPFLIQFLVPTFLVAIYFVDRQFKHDKKLNIILLSSALGYTILSMFYMLILCNVWKGFYQNIANPLSPILQLERLLTKPFGAIILYAFCILYSGINLTLNIVRLAKEKKAPKEEPKQEEKVEEEPTQKAVA